MQYNNRPNGRHDDEHHQLLKQIYRFGSAVLLILFLLAGIRTVADAENQEPKADNAKTEEVSKPSQAAKK